MAQRSAQREVEGNIDEESVASGILETENYPCEYRIFKSPATHKKHGVNVSERYTSHGTL